MTHAQALALQQRLKSVQAHLAKINPRPGQARSYTLALAELRGAEALVASEKSARRPRKPTHRKLVLSPKGKPQ